MIVILGAGISGMLAAWACEQHGRPFAIVDKGPAEDLPRLVKGCVYLHDHCGLEREVRKQRLRTSVLPVSGTPAEELSRLYHHKVWGWDVPYEPNSVDRFADTESVVYSMNDALAYLHARYSGLMGIADASWDNVVDWLRSGVKVVSTVPLRAFFPDISLVSKPLWTFQSEVDGGAGRTAWTVYNVDPLVSWYRMTSMFGNMAVEFIEPPSGAWKVHKFAKIISYDMTQLDAQHPNLLFTGRWGRWQRGFLSHETYHEVCRRFDQGVW